MLFRSSLETIRRDLTVLESEGKIEKIYGGAKIIENTVGEVSLEMRNVSKLAQKQAMASRCSSLIQEGDCIFIDSGSTTYHIAKELKDTKNITVITNSLPVINELITSHLDIIIIGGRLRSNEHSIVAPDYLFNFHELNITKAFICASGITLQNGVSDYNMEEAITRKKIIERSKEVIVVADSSKFGKDVTITIAPLEKVSCIVTDSDLSKSTLTQFKKNNVQLHVVDY